MCINLYVFFQNQLCEFGNLSIHLALRNLRPPGSKERKIPFPDGNPMTKLFNAVSCPNYTYEFGSWLAFTTLTQCLPGEAPQMTQYSVFHCINCYDVSPSISQCLIPSKNSSQVRVIDMTQKSLSTHKMVVVIMMHENRITGERERGDRDSISIEI